ncbi:arylsulfatase [Sphingomonas sp. NFX23]|uniref:arylsulfatase n=1 Tax=Sphingomonas sp. NFX23 TaxID=2819532 RepID=UPI003CF078A3
MLKSQRIAIIHATPAAMAPIREAFRSIWPEAEPVNILEDSLAPDRAKAADIPEKLSGRIASLTRYAVSTGSEAVLFTCSAFGPAIEKAAATVDVPVLKPNAAMFEAVIARGGKTAMLYTFAPAAESMEEEFRKEAMRLGSDAEICSMFVPGAIEALHAGQMATHNGLIAEAARSLSGVDSITLAQFSMAPALRQTQAATPIPVLSSPEQAVMKLRELLSRQTDTGAPLPVRSASTALTETK